MTAVRKFLVLSVLAAAVASGPSAIVAPAQTPGQPADQQQPQPQPADREQEIEQLRARVRELEQQLAAARRHIASLEERLGLNTVTADETDPLVLPEDQPLASIDALLATIAGEYNAEFDAPLLDTDINRRTYLRRLRSWAAQLERQHRGPFTWTANVTDVERLSTGETYLTVVVRDPNSGARLSEEHVLPVPRHLIDRLQDVGAGENTPLELRGVIRLAMNVNEERATPGPFNTPPLIGPYLEFGYELDLQSIAPATIATTEDQPEQQPAPGNGNGSTGG